MPEKTSRRKRHTPNDPEFEERILAAIDRMTWEELEAIMKSSHEGMEETNMNETLRLADERDRKAESERLCAEENARKSTKR